jgi:hypothetical protein
MTNLVFAFVPIFASILLVWVLSRLSVSTADEGRPLSETGNGQLEFAPNKRNYVGVIGLVALLVYMSVSLAIANFSSTACLLGAALWLAIALFILAVFPGSIRVSSDGLQQVYWLWKSKRIAWQDVSKILIDEKRQRVTIIDRKGTKIAHIRQLPDRARLLSEFAKYCGDKLPKEAAQSAMASLPDWMHSQIEVCTR